MGQPEVGEDDELTTERELEELWDIVRGERNLRRLCRCDRGTLRGRGEYWQHARDCPYRRVNRLEEGIID